MKKIIFLSVLLVIIGLAARVFQFSLTPSPKTTVIYFEDGSSLRQMARTLEKEGVVTQARLFEWYVRLQGKEKSLKSGEYEFPQGAMPPQILDMMVRGLVKFYPVTIPEGYNLAEIGKLLIGRGLTTAGEWPLLTTDKKRINDLGVTTANLEGYLFPDTYSIERRTKGSHLVENMVALFKHKVTPELAQRAAQKGFSLHQWVTLASLIEKETGIPQERPLIASVFLNRLKIGMLLQTDPSVIYGVPNFNGNLTRQHLQTPSPYNTYMNAGLPPGPICSPGLDALMAVLDAPETEYLYFVAKGDKSHYFSKTLEEHQKGVNFYQLHQATPNFPPP